MTERTGPDYMAMAGLPPRAFAIEFRRRDDMTTWTRGNLQFDGAIAVDPFDNGWLIVQAIDTGAFHLVRPNPTVIRAERTEAHE